MKKILLPLDETDRSLKTLNYVKKHYTPEEAEFVLLMVDERLGYSVKSEVENAALSELNDKLKLMSATLEGFKVGTLAAVGKAGLRITRAVREVGADLVIMTKSSKPDMLSSIGTTAEYVINNSSCDVLIVSEASNPRNEYRGLVYKTAKGTVNLRGQLGDKQSECLLPSINQDCMYIIDVTVGKVRFFHTAYNPDTRNWDLPPTPGQEVTLDIAAGERKDILVKADSTDGKADRIRIVNRDMKKEAVFNFRIVAADGYVPEEPEKKPEPANSMESRATIEMPRIASADEISAIFEAPEVPTFVPESMQEAPAAETAPAAGSEAAAAAETEAAPVFEAEPEHAAGSEAMPEFEAEPGSEVEAVAEAEPMPGSEQEPAPAAEYEPMPVFEAEAESAAEAEAETEPMPEFEQVPVPAAEYESMPVSEAQQEVASEYEYMPAFEAEAEPAAEAEAVTELMPNLEQEPVPAAEYESMPVFEAQQEVASEYEYMPAFEAEAESAAEAEAESEPMPVSEQETAPVVEYEPMSVFEAESEPTFETEPEPVFESEPISVFEPEPEPGLEAGAEPAPEPFAPVVVEMMPEPTAAIEPEPEPAPEAPAPVVVEMMEAMPAEEPETESAYEPAPAPLVVEEIKQEEPQPVEEDPGAIFSVEIH